MSPRYLLAIGEDLEKGSEVLRLLANRTGLTLGYASADMAALVNPSCRCVSLGQDGCILGYLFPRHGSARQVGGFAAGEAASIVASDGEALLGRFWGGYVAAIAATDSVRVLRDPSGTFPCYSARRGTFSFLASDAELLAATGVPIDIDIEQIGRQLYRAFVPAPTTALRGIRELLAGFALQVGARTDQRRPCWSPWDHVAERDENPTEAAERLSRIVGHCVHAWASTTDRVLLSVSGGLDSSIVAACLSKAGKDTICLTMFTDDPSGDERPFARALCEHLGLPLLERPYRLEDIDILEPLATNLPRPRDRTQAIAHERVHYAVASEIGAGAFMTGNGGDHVFGYSQSAAPVADRYLRHGFGRGIVASLLDVCRQTGCSMADALRQAWRLARASPSYCVRPNPLFLEPRFVAGLGTDCLHHPWLETPAGALPGKAAHIATILRVQPNLEPSGGTRFPLLNPLVSQPIVEACLAVPSWEWRTGGRDRALARRAFAKDLPPLVVDRRVKGTPGRFAARLLDHFRGPIRDRLLGGRLAAHGVIDATALARVLAGERPVDALQRVRILELVNAEAWLDHWAARRQPREAAWEEITPYDDRASLS